MAELVDTSSSIMDSGHCAFRNTCGSKTRFSQPLPCPYTGPAVEPEDEGVRQSLVAVCGADFTEGSVCCTRDQLETLRSQLDTVDNIISSCPACRNNFRSFFCSFTCSSNQGDFVNVTTTQTTSTGETAVKSVDFFVNKQFADGFYNSCKDVQFGTANLFAMSLIGGGAKNALAFLKYLGDEKDLGSPFQINFPQTAPSPPLEQYNAPPRSCADDDLGSRCTCIDCPSVCPALPEVPPPNGVSSCHVGAMSCLTFILTDLYGLLVLGFVLVLVFNSISQRRRERKYERVALAGDSASDNPMSPRSHPRSLVGASSLAPRLDGEDSLGGQSGESRHLGRGASLVDPAETLQPRQYRLNTILRKFFNRMGMSCASYPWLTLTLVFMLVGILNMGLKRFEIETDPVRLWVAPNSESKLQKEYFDEHFGPFYRIEQIFITVASSRADEDAMWSDSLPHTPPVLSWENLKRLSTIYDDIGALRSPNDYGLEDVCFKPAGPDGACVAQSVLGWFIDGVEGYEDGWEDQIQGCAATPSECLPDFQQPLQPEYVLGGVSADQSDKDWLQAQALIVTILVSDSLDKDDQGRAMEWETTLRAYMEGLQAKSEREYGLTVRFSTGISLEEEINKSTNMDVRIVILSYLMMFFYVSMTLGHNVGGNTEKGVFGSLRHWVEGLQHRFARQGPSTSLAQRLEDSQNTCFLPRIPRMVFVNSKFVLGLFGIALVILSVLSSVATFSFAGVKVTLIIAEVIPFLVLAVGVDNIFILVHELDKQTLQYGPNATAGPFGAATPTIFSPHFRSSPFSSTHGDVSDNASTPLHLSVEERVARALAKMGPSILLSTLTETVAFALGALVPMPAVRNFALYAAGSVFINAALQVTAFVSAMTLDLRRVEANRVDCFPCVRVKSRITLPDGAPIVQSSQLALFIRRHYAPFLLKPIVKYIVLILFGGIFLGSVISIQHIQLGLDQRLALPSDSYLIPYFDALDAYLDVGPPVYFVSTNVDPTTRTGQRHLCGRFTTCDEFSIATVLELERSRAESSYISQPTASWIDDFFNWIDPAKDSCCRVRKARPDLFCKVRDSPRLCRPCFEGRTPAWNITMDGLPEGPEFMDYLQVWLEAPSNEACPLGGKAAYASAISLTNTSVEASHFRTFHAPLKSQSDYIHSFEAAHRIAGELSERTGATVFPYSVHYVYFDQYAHIIATSQEILGLGLAAVLVISALLLGSWRTGTIVAGTVALTVVSVMGIMGIWGINLNAISLVNLVISLGIAVEFCSHIARAFMGAGTGIPMDQFSGQKERDERTWTALVDVGPSVLSGITFTKLIGMAVLGLTRSRLLEIYYFRMWLTLIISGALHSLVLLPVVLSFAGGPGYALENADEEWMSTTVRRYDYEPFLAEDDASIRSD